MTEKEGNDSLPCDCEVTTALRDSACPKSTTAQGASNESGVGALVPSRSESTRPSPAAGGPEAAPSQRSVAASSSIQMERGLFRRRTILTYTGAAFTTALLPDVLGGCTQETVGEMVRTTTQSLVLPSSVMAPKLKGSHPWAVILCVASDEKIPSWPPISHFLDLVSSGHGGLYDYWNQVSGGLLDIKGSGVYGWYQLTKTAAELAKFGKTDLALLARAAAVYNAGVDLSPGGQFEHVIAVVSDFSDQGNTGKDVSASFSDFAGQPGWRWCSNCQSLAFYDGTAAHPGACAAAPGAFHVHDFGFPYAPYFDVNTIPSGKDPSGQEFVTAVQSGWCWCNKCQAMVFQTATPANCPGGGQHSLSPSLGYVFRLDGGTVPPTLPAEQDGWRRCGKCQGLVVNANPQGACPMGGSHDVSGSDTYTVPIGWAVDLGFFSHETGHGLGLQHSFGISRSGALGDDERPGAYGDAADIMGSPPKTTANGDEFRRHGCAPNGPTLHKLGWLPASDVFRLIPGAGQSTVTLKNLFGGSGNIRMIQVERPEEGAVYTVEHRTNVGLFDRSLGHPRVIVHRLPNLYTAGQDLWLGCQLCKGLIYAGTTPCPSGGVHDGSSSADYGLFHDVATGGEPNWRWCSKCNGLAYAGGGTSAGACPAGGAHDLSQSGNYVLASSTSGQWRRCKKCQGLGFGNHATTGICPGGDLHDYSSSANYVLGGGSGPNQQNKWRWCWKCQGLYYAGFAACKGGDVHQFNAEYCSITHDYPTAVGQTGWNWCRKCFALAFASTPRGACPGGGTHDQSLSLAYSLPINAEVAAGQPGWNRCTKCSVIFNGGGGVCPIDGGAHSSQGDSGSRIIAHDTMAVTGRIQQGRWCQKCYAMIIGNNPPSCAKGGNHDTTNSLSYVIRKDPALLAREEAFYRQCSKCSALMKLRVNAQNGECPADGGMHAATDVEFFLTYQGTATWRWCRNCQVLAYWPGSPSQPGPCPATGGTHDHSQSMYYDPPTFRDAVTQAVALDLLSGQSYANASGTVVFNVLSLGSSDATIQVTSG
jgi:hypothetical protein